MKKIVFNRFNTFFMEYKDEVNELITKTLSSGKYIRDINNADLEQKLCVLSKRDFALTTASCTDALFFALTAAGVQAGDEVILPAFSYIASVSPVLMCGAIPVFVDIDSRDWMLNMHAIEEAVTPKTKAIIFVQLFGNLRNIEALHEWTKKQNIVLIEDAAQALGATNGSKNGGGSGDISCISFDPTKIVSAYGTGGAVLTDNIKYFEIFKKLVHHGRNKSGDFEILGYNSKISEINASIINLQLKYLDKIIESTTSVAQKYYSLLQDINEIELCEIPKHSKSTFHKFVIRAKNRDELRDYLHKNGIETRIHYNPLLQEHKLLQNTLYHGDKLSVSKQVKQNVISLPIYQGLKHDEIEFICKCIRKFFNKI
jgi:UDP-2-acetamido-2-deoxy-ribo-hexuluronate aminotransferase